MFLHVVEPIARAVHPLIDCTAAPAQRRTWTSLGWQTQQAGVHTCKARELSFFLRLFHWPLLTHTSGSRADLIVTPPCSTRICTRTRVDEAQCFVQWHHRLRCIRRAFCQQHDASACSHLYRTSSCCQRWPRPAQGSEELPITHCVFRPSAWRVIRDCSEVQ